MVVIVVCLHPTPPGLSKHCIHFAQILDCSYHFIGIQAVCFFDALGEDINDRILNDAVIKPALILLAVFCDPFTMNFLYRRRNVCALYGRAAGKHALDILPAGYRSDHGGAAGRGMNESPLITKLARLLDDETDNIRGVPPKVRKSGFIGSILASIEVKSCVPYS